MASNVSKCAQTFSISVMTYVKTKELQLQCHCIALNSVKNNVFEVYIGQRECPKKAR